MKRVGICGKFKAYKIIAAQPSFKTCQEKRKKNVCILEAEKKKRGKKKRIYIYI